MCNLYRMTRTQSEIAGLFDAIADVAGGNAPGEVYPGQPGMVVADGRVRQMVWGFPLSRKGAKGQQLKPKPVNNARTDKLLGGFWKASFTQRRCLIPVDCFAEAEGVTGGKTRTWFSFEDGAPMAVAGIWRQSDEWGDVYSMVMTEACETVGGIHDRMPVILPEADHATWLAGPAQAAHELCVPWPGKLAINRTDEPWAGWKPGDQARLI